MAHYDFANCLASVQVPRGEYSFVVKDLGHPLPVTYSEWPEALVLESEGQVSEMNFTERKYFFMPSAQANQHSPLG